MITIQTQRLLLRPAQDSDLDAMHQILSHPPSMRYWSTLPHTSLKQSEDWLQSMIDTTPEQGLDFIIEMDGKTIGKAGVWRLPEIGFIIHPDYSGKGIISEALAAIIPQIFKSYAIPAIEADVDPRNLGSLAVLQKFRFEETGRAKNTMKLGDEWCDSIYLALIRPD